MAYSDYGAFVYENGKRRTDKEDVALFASDEETFGEDSVNIPSGIRIYAHLLHQLSQGSKATMANSLCHGVIGDGAIRVRCYKTGLPDICELTNEGVNAIKYVSDDTDPYYYKVIDFEYKDYKFKFMSGKPYIAIMIEPDGTEWLCEYDIGYGAGFEE